MDRIAIKNLLNKHYSTVGYMAEILDFRMSLARAHQLLDQGIRKPGEIGHESKEYGIPLQDLPRVKVSEIELERILFELFPVTDLENIDSIDQQMPLDWFEETVVEEMTEAMSQASDIIMPTPVELGNENITFVNSETFDQTVLPYTEKTRAWIFYHKLKFEAHPRYHNMCVITPPDLFFTLPNRYYMTCDGHDFNFFRLHEEELTKPLLDINHFAVVYNTNAKGQILSSIRHHQAKVYPNTQQLPGGKVDYGDSILRAAATEFCEETNTGSSPQRLEQDLHYAFSYRHFQYGKPTTYVHVFRLYGSKRLQPQFNELCKLSRTWKYELRLLDYKACPAYSICYSLFHKGELPHPSNLVPTIFDNDCELYRYDAPHKGLDWFSSDEITDYRIINTGHGKNTIKFY